jgi:hypothetical protein
MMDALNRFGTVLLNRSLANEAMVFLKDQLIEFNLPMGQLRKNGTFHLNYALTSDPKIHNGVMDLNFFMDIGPKDHHCILA